MATRAAIRSDWTLEEVRALHALPFADLMHCAQSTHRAALRPERRAGLDAALDQDRRLPRGLRLLPAEHPLRHGPRARGADGARRRSSRARAPRATPARRASAWAPPGGVPKDRDLEHVVAMVEGVARARPRDLRDARHADRRRRRRACRRRGSTTTTTTSTRREAFYGEVITTRTYQDRLDTLAARPRRRHQRLLRRHPRHGRERATTASHSCTRSRRSTRIPRACRSTTSCRSRARRSPARARSIRSSSCASSRSRAS